MEAALYGEDGFFTSGHGAGRAGRDFVTSPEVGSLFGACMARAIDRMWHALGDPDPFLVVEAGAGNGRLAREVLRARPACVDALRYVLVERSSGLRQEQRVHLPLEPPDEALGPFVRREGEDRPVPAAGVGPVFASLEELPAFEADDAVVLANELLDNLPFGIAQWDGERWLDVRVGLDANGMLEEVLVPADHDPGLAVAPGTRVPVPSGMHEWWLECEHLVRRGFVLAIDYTIRVEDLAERPWLRTYRAHEHGTGPLVDPGSQDITADVLVEQLVASSPFDLVRHDTQSAWLDALGIGTLVTEGRQAWEDGAHRGDLAALAGRSRISEGRALTDPAGLGAHEVFLFVRGLTADAFDWVDSPA